MTPLVQPAFKRISGRILVDACLTVFTAAAVPAARAGLLQQLRSGSQRYGDTIGPLNILLD